MELTTEVALIALTVIISIALVAFIIWLMAYRGYPG